MEKDPAKIPPAVDWFERTIIGRVIWGLFILAVAFVMLVVLPTVGFYLSYKAAAWYVRTIDLMIEFFNL